MGIRGQKRIGKRLVGKKNYCYKGEKMGKESWGTSHSTYGGYEMRIDMGIVGDG